MTAPTKVRVHEISKVLGVSNAKVIDVLAKEFKVSVKSHSSTVEQTTADHVIAYFQASGNKHAASAPKLTPESSVPELSNKPTSAETPIVTTPIRQDSLDSNVSANVSKGSVSEPPKQQTQQYAQQQSHQYPKNELPRSVPPTPSSDTRVAPPQQAGTPFKQQVRSNFPHNNPQVSPQNLQRPFSKPNMGPPIQVPPHNQNQPARPNLQPGVRENQPRENKPVSTTSPAHSLENPSNATVTTNFPPKVPDPREPQREQKMVVQNPLPQPAAPPAPPKLVHIDDRIVIRDLAEKLGLRETEVIKHLFMKGMMVTVNQTLDHDYAKTVAREFGFEVVETEVVQHLGEYAHLDTERKKLNDTEFFNLQGRSPVVSIMGHVDHGKTTLLDSIRETRHKVVDSEAGGITQTIGAYTVEKDEHRIVFLDTPGHEAFTSMRMRGAHATDIAILVVAADDGVMPQTIEAINHAKAAKIPIIVAVNKIDKANADPDRVLVQLADYGLSSEKWGGETLTVEVSALQKLGLDDLLDSILLVAELLELKADPTVSAQGIIIEAQLDKRMGPIANALVQNGTLRIGDNLLIGSVGGRVRALIDDHGARVLTAGPATPVEILGLSGVPNAGDTFRVIRNDKQFKQELLQEKLKEREQRVGVNRNVSAGFSGRSEQSKDIGVRENQFNLLVKSDSQGSLEAVVEVLQRMTNDEVKINIVHSAAGDVSEADVMLASTANALIIAFNSKTDTNAFRLSEQEGVVIKNYDVIYHITEEIQKWVLGQLAPETEEVQVGSAEIRQIFKVGKTNVIAGCMVTSGKLMRSAKAIVLRDGKEIFSGPLNNLKRFKDDVKEVAAGYECGISFERFQDLQEGDIVDVYTTKSLERTSL